MVQTTPKFLYTLVILFTITLLAACVPTTGDTEPVSVTATVAVAEATPTVAVTPESTMTPTPLAADPSPTSTSTACSDAARFVADVTVPDNSQVEPGTGFVKTWRVENSGTCTWDGRYRLAHTGGDLLGAISPNLPLPATVAPGQAIDLSVSLVAPATAGPYRGDWKLRNAQGVHFGAGGNDSPLWVKIVVATPEPVDQGSISGFAWQDQDSDNQVDGNEMLSGVSISLSRGQECATSLESATTDANGRFRFTNLTAGSYCLSGSDGDVTVGQSGLALGQNQRLTDVDVTWPPLRPQPATISGWVWNDYCAVHTGTDGNPVVDGNCDSDGNGGYRANGMLEADEETIAGVTVKLHRGACSVDNISVLQVAQTDGDGRYIFNGLEGGTYCVFIEASEGGNAAVLLSGEWTFPRPGIRSQQITVRTGDHANPVNFGWDYDTD